MYNSVVRHCVFLACFSASSANAGSVDQLLIELQGSDFARITATLPINEAIQTKTEQVSNESRKVVSSEECTIHCRGEHHWRLDSLDRFPEPVSFCRDGDLRFVAISRAGGYGFDRVGFDLDVARSIEGSVRTRAEAVFDATHVLELPVDQFAKQDGISFGPRTELSNPQSDNALTWDLSPPVGSETLPAHGYLEWRLFDKVPRITYLRYAFGERPALGQTTDSGIEVNLEYDLDSGWPVPKKVVRSSSKSTTKTIVTRLGAVQTDLTFYSPSAFGLDRPRKPIPRWAYWIAVAFVLAGTAIVARKLRGIQS